MLAVFLLAATSAERTNARVGSARDTAATDATYPRHPGFPYR
jgi:hypothetical protein